MPSRCDITYLCEKYLSMRQYLCMDYSFQNSQLTDTVSFADLYLDELEIIIAKIHQNDSLPRLFASSQYMVDCRVLCNECVTNWKAGSKTSLSRIDDSEIILFL